MSCSMSGRKRGATQERIETGRTARYRRELKREREREKERKEEGLRNRE